MRKSRPPQRSPIINRSFKNPEKNSFSKKFFDQTADGDEKLRYCLSDAEFYCIGPNYFVGKAKEIL
jgi:hypothetical protein